MGLLKTGLKAAVAVKTADVIHERVLARQQEQWAAHGHTGAPPAGAQPGVPAPGVQPGAPTAAVQPGPPAGIPAAAPASAGMADTIGQLKELGELRASGVLTDAEFEAQKARILSA